MSTLLRFIAALGCCSTLCAPSPAQVPSWPNKALKIVVVNAPGGLPDIAARAVATELSKSVGQPVVVENRPGAGGNIASLYVAKAPADGYTMLLTGFNMAVNPTLTPNPGFDYEKDLAPVSLVAEGDMLILANPALPAKNISELIALGRQKPGGLSIAIAPIGSPNHVGAELLAQASGMDLVMVMYQGIAPAMPDLVSGRVDLAIAAIGPSLTFMKSGKLKGLAATTLKRTPFAPEVPTAVESGLPGFDLNTWVCLMTTGGTPKPVVNRLSGEIRKVMALPDLRESLARQGATAVSSTPEELDAYIKAEAVKWASVLKSAKMK